MSRRSLFINPRDCAGLLSADGTPLRSIEVVMQHCSERRFDGYTDWSRELPTPSAARPDMLLDIDMGDSVFHILAIAK